MNYCSHCGSDQLAFAIPAGDNLPRYICKACQTIHYQNPKVVVGCLPVYADQIVLCRRAIEPRKGFWNLPAGYLENGETLAQGAQREAWEEAFLQGTLVRMHAVYDIPHINQVYCFFLMEVPEANWKIGPETLEIALFQASDMPYDEMAFPSSTFAIKRYLAHRNTGYHGVHLGGWPPDAKP